MPPVSFHELIRNFIPGFVVLSSLCWTGVLLREEWHFADLALDWVAEEPLLAALLVPTGALLAGLMLNSLSFSFAFNSVIREWYQHARKPLAGLAAQTLRAREQFKRIQEAVANDARSISAAHSELECGDVMPDYFLSPPPSRDAAAVADERHLYYSQFQFHIAVAVLFLTVPATIAPLRAWGFCGLTVVVGAVALIVATSYGFVYVARKNYLAYTRARNSWMLAALRRRDEDSLRGGDST